MTKLVMYKQKQKAGNASPQPAFAMFDHLGFLPREWFCPQLKWYSHVLNEDTHLLVCLGAYLLGDSPSHQVEN